MVFLPVSETSGIHRPAAVPKRRPEQTTQKNLQNAPGTCKRQGYAEAGRMFWLVLNKLSGS